MDVQREGVAERRRKRQVISWSIIGVLLVLFAWWLIRLEPAPPSVSRAAVYLGTVERGEMLRQVRGPGTLVPEEIRWLPAQTSARIERRVVLPGAQVEPDTIILELSDPGVEQEARDAELRLAEEEANYRDTEVELQRQLLNERAQAATVESSWKQAVLQAEADEELNKEGLIPELTAKLSKLRADEAANRNRIERERLSQIEAANRARLTSAQARLDQARALYDLRRDQLEGLKVKAGIYGVLQEIPVEIGQQVTPGTNLARVAQPEKLKAELRIPETQAKDVTVGQLASIDTRNGIIEGRVVRIDPAVRNGSVTVDVTLTGELPRGARPDLSVDGTVELERLVDVLYVNRPAYGQANSRIGLFRLDTEGDVARRVQVQLGRSSVTTIEIVEGLQEGDEVVLSDTSQYDEYDRIRLN
ncbi:MAG: HlyD family efflux transporter periplasmic adaptor subunit [Acidobacteriota bacterium]